MSHPVMVALAQACEEAERFRGATAPNPAVGAAALNKEGIILSVQAHQKAGTPHAEAQVIADCRARGILNQIHQMVVTLEPCNHQGRTPPCSEALLALPSLKRVAFAVSDPNPKAEGGAERLKRAGIEVVDLGRNFSDAPEVLRARELSRPFLHWLNSGRPWVTVKTVWRQTGAEESMIPPSGQKTFSNPDSLKQAHELRKRADAIVTGSGTVLADWPELTVRHVADHSEKSRWLAIMDRRGRVPEAWLDKKRQQGFRVIRSQDFTSLLEFLGAEGVLEVLVEAGPEFSASVLASGLWNEHYKTLHFEHNDQAGQMPRREVKDVTHVYRNY